MMTLTPATLSGMLQTLIDARLDTIDRMLIEHLPRSQRIEIVGEVESQIHELLSRQNTAEITREDVLNVFRRLDPPEAYLEEDRINTDSVLPRRNRDCVPEERNSLPSLRHGRGWLGGMFGLCALADAILLLPLAWIVAVLLGSDEFAYFACTSLILLGIASSIAALVLSVGGRREGMMPIIGIITSSSCLSLFLLVLTYFITFAMQ